MSIQSALARSVGLATLALIARAAGATDFGVAAGNFSLGPSWVGNVVPGTNSDANINNGGTAAVNAGDALEVSRLRIGVNAGDSGAVEMTGGALKISVAGGDPDDTGVAIGNSGTGTFTLSGGTLTYGTLGNGNGDFHIGKNSAAGSTMTIKGGQVLMGGTLRIARGTAGNGAGTLTMTGGEFDIGEGAVVGRGDSTGTKPVGTLDVAGTARFIAGNSKGDGNANGYSGEGFLSIGNLPNATGHVTVRDTGLVKARRLTGRQGAGDLTIQDNAQFFVVNTLGIANGGVLYGSFLGGGNNSNGDGSDGASGSYQLTVKNLGLLDVDANAFARDVGRPELQGFILARGNSTANAAVSGGSKMIVRQRLVIGGLGANANLNGFDGLPGGGTNPGGTSTVTVTGGTLSADQLIVGGSGTGTLNATGGVVNTLAYNATFDPTANGGAGSAATSVNSIRIGMLAGSTGVMTVANTASISTGGDLGIGQYGNGTLRVTGGAASVQAKDVYVQKFAGSAGTLSAGITGDKLTAVKATGNVTINGGTFQVISLAPPASGAYQWDVLVADSDSDGTGALTGKFTTLTLPADDAIGRRWSAFYVGKKFTVGLTTPGDATFDGKIEFNDLVPLAQHYNGPGQWPDGDFTRNGFVDFDDLIFLAQNYNTAVPGAVPGAPANFDADVAAAFASVPEPTGAWTVALAATALIGRRARKQRSSV